MAVVREHPDLYEVYALSANRSVELLIRQAREFKPEVVCIADENYYESLREALQDLPIKVWCGAESIAQMVTFPSVDIVVAAMVGYAGLSRQYHAPILPVDSEHSAIFQSLVGEDPEQVEKILLTASGGPFLRHSAEQLLSVTAAEALKHPNWEMGSKITIDSASMMNKGFEVIEAKWLFGVPVDSIQVLVHPQSIVHSAVQFVDGSIKAQLGMPDMRLPIQYALSYPDRLPSSFPRLDLFTYNTLTFMPPDMERFPCLQLAYEAVARGGNIPCVLNAANEVANLAFRQGKIGFMQMPEIIAETMARASFIAKPTYEDYVATDSEARRKAKQLIVDS